MRSYIGIESARFNGSINSKIIANQYRNELSGGFGNDEINGKFGLDILYSGQNKDNFIFDSKLDKQNNLDVIKDFIAKLVIALNESSKNIHEFNGHYYEYVDLGGLNWEQSKTLSDTRSYQCAQGYLATVTSIEERNFIDQVFFASDKSDNVFVGGSDANAEGV